MIVFQSNHYNRDVVQQTDSSPFEKRRKDSDTRVGSSYSMSKKVLIHKNYYFDRKINVKQRYDELYTAPVWTLWLLVCFWFLLAINICNKSVTLYKSHVLRNLYLLYLLYSLDYWLAKWHHFLIEDAKTAEEDVSHSLIYRRDILR